MYTINTTTNNGQLAPLPPLPTRFGPLLTSSIYNAHLLPNASHGYVYTTPHNAYGPTNTITKQPVKHYPHWHPPPLPPPFAHESYNYNTNSNHHPNFHHNHIPNPNPHPNLNPFLSPQPQPTDSQIHPLPSPAHASLRARDGRHPRSGPGALAAAVCVLDPCITPRRTGGSEGPLGRGGSSQSVGGLGQGKEQGRGQRAGGELEGAGERLGGSKKTQSLRRRRDEARWRKELGGSREEIIMMDATAAPNGWLFWPDASGFSANEVTLRLNLGRRGIVYESVGGTDSDEVDCLGVELEGDKSLAEESVDESSRCFNCGSPTHFLTSCPAPRNAALIALSRSYYTFFKQSADSSGEPQRLHTVEEQRQTRLKWIEAFVPGEVRGAGLREALGLREGDLGEEAPWLSNMLVWGYPPGWARAEDPVQAMRARVDSGGDEFESFVNEDSFVIFGGNEDAEDEQVRLSDSRKPKEDETISPPLLLPLESSTSRFGTEATGIQAEEAQSGERPRRRRATYHTSLFSSELLPIYNGLPLPPLDDEDNDYDSVPKGAEAVTPFSKEMKGRTPPWRRPGSFEGDWLNYSYANESNSPGSSLARERTNTSSTSFPLTPPHSPTCSSDSEHSVDMDFSD